jgi:hypothetical protein
MGTEKELNQFVSEECLSHIRDRIKAGVVDAEAKFNLNQEDEDAITGALGQAISTAMPIIFKGTQGNYTYHIQSYKIRGRGPNAPEKTLGADAIFQISVFHNNEQIFTKGLPFQAKKEGGFNNAAVKKQAGDLYRASGTGIVVRYSKDGYTAVDVRVLIRESEALQAGHEPKPRKLAIVFGDDFLDCRVGKQGLYLPKRIVDGDGHGIWVFNTQIHKL